MAPFLDVAAGQTIESAHMDLAISQSVMRFTNAAQRDAQVPAPTVGMVCYLQDLNYLQVFDAPVTGGANAWRVYGSLRMGYARMGKGQVIPANADTVITCDLTLIGGGANRPGRATWAADGGVTVPLTGVYLVTADIAWPDNSTGERRFWVQHYETGVGWGMQGISGGTSEVNNPYTGAGGLRMSVSAVVAAVANERISLVVRHSATASLTLPSSGADTGSMHIHMLGVD